MYAEWSTGIRTGRGGDIVRWYRDTPLRSGGVRPQDNAVSEMVLEAPTVLVAATCLSERAEGAEGMGDGSHAADARLMAGGGGRIGGSVIFNDRGGAGPNVETNLERRRGRPGGRFFAH